VYGDVHLRPHRGLVRAHPGAEGNRAADPAECPLCRPEGPPGQGGSRRRRSNRRDLTPAARGQRDCRAQCGSRDIARLGRLWTFTPNDHVAFVGGVPTTTYGARRRNVAGAGRRGLMGVVAAGGLVGVVAGGWALWVLS